MRARATLLLGLLAATAAAAQVDLALPTNALGLRLYAQVTPQNTCTDEAFSPYSIELAMSTLAAGAEGRTREELVQVLGLPADPPAILEAAHSLRLHTAFSAEKGTWDDGVGLFVQNNVPLRPDFVQGVTGSVGAVVQPVDFRGNPSDAANRINLWVSSLTQARITHLVSDVPSGCSLILANAVYLQAAWEHPFGEPLTRERPFHLADGTDAPRMTMTDVRNLGYRRAPGYQAVALPYEGTLQMVILLPDARAGAPALARSLAPHDMTAFKDLDRRKELVELRLPRFRTPLSSINLSAAFRHLGLRRAFEPGQAEFGGIASGSRLFVGDVVHEAYVATDEAGTVAVAATGIELSTYEVSAGPAPKPIPVYVDHPFLFFIQDTLNGTCLFMGSIANPGAP
jgi:serpin B